MQYEVEQKFLVENPRELLARFDAMGIELGLSELQSDVYFAHPCRDFAATDEALRIRRAGGENFLTYKGPRIDSTTKTRREIEIPLPPAADGSDPMRDTLEALGFRPVAEVRKHRRYASLQREGWPVEIVLDDVEKVGLYAELEIVASREGVDAAREVLAALAAELGLVVSERRSYLELLLLGG